MTKMLPNFSRPRRGYPLSVADAIVQVLWKDSRSNKWPAKAFCQLYEEASMALGRQTNKAVIRGVVYRHPDIFVREEGGEVKWQLSQLARSIGD